MFENIIFILAIMVFITLIIITLTSFLYIRGLIRDWVIDIVAYTYITLFIIVMLFFIISVAIHIIKLCRGGL
jgi:hypothetical protein